MNRNKQRRMILGLGLLALLALLGTGCSGGTYAIPSAHAATLAAPVITSFGVKSTSGAPDGLYVTWTRHPSPNAAGYNLYRDTESIPDWAPLDTPPVELRVNTEGLIPHPASGESVTYNDIFDVDFGETYYYRVTAVDIYGEEGFPSGEVSYTVANFTVTTVAPDTAYWGDEVTISGTNLGDTQKVNDSVAFPAAGGGQVEGTVTNWTDTAVSVTVPELAVTGNVTLVVEGTSAQTDNVLTIPHPFISGLAPNPGFLEQGLTILGGNFGATQGSSSVMIGPVDCTAAVTAWAGDEITLTVPATVVESNVVVMVDSRDSNAVTFVPQAEILGVSPEEAQDGETVTVTGRFFGTAHGRVLLNGTTEMGVITWSDTSISFTLNGSAGDHKLTVETELGSTSNEVDYTIIAPLTVAISGLTANELYTPDTIPAITVTTALDADRVELLVDGKVVYESTNAPFNDIVFPLKSINNGTHTVTANAFRRTITASSEPVPVRIYSLVGDINTDGIVNALDRDLLETLIGLTSADAGFAAWFDTDEDGEVTEADLANVGYHWDESIEGYEAPTG